MIIPAEWHHNLSTQRWSSTCPSAQRWSSACPSTQRQSSACPLVEVSDVLYCGSQGLDHQAGAPEGHSPHRGGDGIHIHNPCGLILHNVTGAHHDHSRFNCCFQPQGFWGCLISICQCNGSFSRQTITSWKPRGGATSPAVSRGPVGNVGSGFVPSICRCFSTLWN